MVRDDYDPDKDIEIELYTLSDHVSDPVSGK